MSAESYTPPSTGCATVEKEEGVDLQNRVVDECGDEATKETHIKHDKSFNQDANLDSALEEAATRRNLTALNVKSIIHVSPCFGSQARPNSRVVVHHRPAGLHTGFFSGGGGGTTYGSIM